MLLLNPSSATFGSTTLADVIAVAIDHQPAREVIDFSDLGHHPAFADVPEQIIRIRLVRSLVRDDLSTPRPAQQATLAFHTSPTRSDASRKRLSATCVVSSVSHELGHNAARQTITFIAISPDGESDPITIS
ncbi:MAG: hypothetical protein H7Y88_08315 [Phycisphaerales bacterium]|nr:hypothetical protein [Phycisphaerales bacterium]